MPLFLQSKNKQTSICFFTITTNIKGIFKRRKEIVSFYIKSNAYGIRWKLEWILFELYSVIYIIFNVFCNSAWYSNRWTINCKNVILPWLQICKESSKMVSNEWECNWIKYTHGKRKWMNVSRDCSTIISIIITIKDDKEATNYKSHSYVQMKLLFSVCSK